MCGPIPNAHRKDEDCKEQCQMEAGIPGACGGLCQFLRWRLLDERDKRDE